MNKTVGTILGFVIWFIGFALTLLVASVPKWNEWPTDDIRTFFSYFMAMIMFSVTPACAGALIYKTWKKNEKH